MTSMHVTERARRAEDDYFRRKDAELIERATRGQAAAVDVQVRPYRELSLEDPRLLELGLLRRAPGHGQLLLEELSRWIKGEVGHRCHALQQSKGGAKPRSAPQRGLVRRSRQAPFLRRSGPAPRNRTGGFADDTELARDLAPTGLPIGRVVLSRR